jgi:signal transduction histidine kinase
MEQDDTRSVVDAALQAAASLLRTPPADPVAAVRPVLPLLRDAAAADMPLSACVRRLQALKRESLQQAGPDAEATAEQRGLIDACFDELILAAADCWSEAWMPRNDEWLPDVAGMRGPELGEQATPSQISDTVDDLQTVLNATDNGVVIVDPDGLIRFINQRVGEMFGIEVQHVAGRRETEALLPLVRTRVANPEEYEARSRSMYERLDEAARDEIETLEPDVRVIQRYSGPIRGRLGQLLGRVQVYADVTAQRRAERARDQFLSVAAHELKTPITSLKGYAQLLQRAIGRGGAALDPGRLGERLTAILRQTDRLTELVDDLLEVSRIQSDRAQLHPETMSLDELAQGVTQRFQSDPTMSEAHRIELRTAKRPLIGFWDPERLEQVLSNLLGNAIKYSPEGGVVGVRLSRSGDLAKVSVSDQGIGIPATEVKALFQPFARAANAARGNSGGVGLGLFISREIVERHGGRIWVQSREGRGSTFHFTLPIRRA